MDSRSYVGAACLWWVAGCSGASGSAVPEAPGEDATPDTDMTVEPAEADAGFQLPEGPTRPVTVQTPTTAGCDGQTLREGIPEDLAAPGPWPVGAVTTSLGGITTEVFYPAEQGSEEGQPRVVYDVRQYLPESERAKIPDERSPWQPCDCFADLPIDAEAGPYPVLVFVHGTAGFRTTNLENVVHWASRGFVVVSSDHPGISLGDTLGLALGAGGGAADQAGDARRVLEQLQAPAGEVAFLDGRLDLTRVGAMGHSAGGGAVSQLVDVADVIIPYAGGSAMAADRVGSALFVTGDTDGVVAASTDSYEGSDMALRRSVWIARGGHLVGASMCSLRDPSDPANDLIDLAGEFQIGGPLLGLALPLAFGALFDGCNELPDDDAPFINAARGVEILSYVSAGQFEESLHCSQTAAAALAGTRERFGDDIASYDEVTGQ